MTVDTSDSAADQLILSYRPVDGTVRWQLDEAARIHDELTTDRFRSYLQTVHGGPVAVGDQWTEFVNGGCGTQLDVLLRVEQCDGGTVFGDSTTLVFDFAAAETLDSSDGVL